MKWITRENVKVDRVACPWLIQRFVDPAAEFLFVPEDQLLAAACAQNAIPYDATQFPEIKLNHRGERCTFEAILEDYKLSEPALQQRLGRMHLGTLSCPAATAIPVPSGASSPAAPAASCS